MFKHLKFVKLGRKKCNRVLEATLVPLCFAKKDGPGILDVPSNLVFYPVILRLGWFCFGFFHFKVIARTFKY